jgi:hypothetical protein
MANHLITLLVIGPVPIDAAPVPTSADELLASVLDPNAADDPFTELQLLAFDGEEVAGRLDILFGPFVPGVPASMVHAVQQTAASALPGDDPVDFTL